MNIFKNKEYLQTTRVNTLPFRCHYIPFDVNQDFEYIHGIIDKTKSHKYIPLNGNWFFKEHKIFTELKDINEKLTDQINVPSCVQLLGYDYIQYTNWKYPFPFNPPYVPDENPCFHYRKTINLDLKDNYYLVFEGVDNAFYVYVNGEYVGYSQISHSKSEFDITKFLRCGENVIDVIVLKWSKSSYLEDQDKFRFSGIFRDVYLLNRKTNHIWDYKIEPIKENDNWFFYVTNLSKNEFQVGFAGEIHNVKVNKTLKLKILNPILWSPENPYLYEIILSNDSEKILEKVGLRNVYIKDRIFYINDKHIKLKGVNRHESNPKTGASVSIEDTLKDILLIKSINANAIRTSHYPCIPEFYELCDLHGLYVLDEADLETHGAVLDNYNLQLWQDFANNGLFDEGVYDREVSLYERDKNKTCVIIWSLGNESNYGKMFYLGADYLKQYDNRPIHYEGLFNLVDRSEYYTDKVDIISMMYPSFETIKEKFIDDPKEHRPLCLCEYTHAMGNSCGDVADYWKLINSNDYIIGAFVWEWCDHAVEVDGKLLYGTDFPERHNDGHFCVDGIVTPYREFKSNTLEIKSVYEGKLYPDEPDYKCENIELKSSNTSLRCIFDDENASIKELYIKDRLFNLTPIKPNFIRADIDNEMHIWAQLEKVRKANIKVLNKIETEGTTTYKCLLVEPTENIEILSFDISYILNDDSLIIDYSYELKGGITPSKVGLYFSVNKFDEFEFVGYGPDESYIDKCVHNKYGKHKYLVKNNMSNNLKPQECGSRYGVCELDTSLFKVTSEKPFSFNIQNYSINNIFTTKHNYELVEEDKTYICLDIFNNGVGSHSCGPELAAQYKLPKKSSNIFKIKIK